MADAVETPSVPLLQWRRAGNQREEKTREIRGRFRGANPRKPLLSLELECEKGVREKGGGCDEAVGGSRREPEEWPGRGKY